MGIALAATFFFGILTLWVPAFWPVTVFQVAVFALASVTLLRERGNFPPFSYPIIPLAFAALWGVFQWLAGLTVYPFETKIAIAAWTTLLAVFLIGSFLFRDPSIRHWFRLAMLWFGFLVAIVATVQTFTADGEVFWIFPTGYSNVMGPILSRNHYGAFIEAVLPIAIFEALRRERDSLLYTVMAAVMYASVIASASRAGTVLVTAEVLVVIAILWLRGQATGRAIGLSLARMVVAIGVFVAVVGWQAVWDRFWVPDPYAGRREFVLSSLSMIADRPWFGFGLGAWPTVYPSYATIDVGALANRAHCDWVEWTADGGVAFGLMLGTLFLWCLRPAFRSVWGLGVIAVFLHATVDYPFSRPALASWPILIIAMLSCREQQAEEPVAPA